MAVRLRSLQLSDDERREDGGSWRRRIVWTLVIGLIAGGAVAAVRYRNTASAEVPELSAVTFGDRSGENIVTDLTGYIVPHRRVNITPRSAGTIVEFPVEEGHRVKKGDLVALVDPTTYRAEYEQANAALAMAEAQLEELEHGALPEEIEAAKALVEQAKAVVDVVEKDLKRKMETLSKHSGAVTAAEMEQLQSKRREAYATLNNQEQQLALIERGPREEKIRAAKAEVQRNRALVERAKYWMDNTRLTSPIDGVVLEKKAEAGEDVHPELVFTSLCVIADLNNMEAEVNVQEQEIGRIKLGQPCEVIPDAYPDRVYKAELSWISPFVNKAQGVVPVKVRILEPDAHLLVDMNCRVIFHKHPDDAKQQTEQPPMLPKTAVLNQEGKSFVWVVQNQTAQKRPIEIGASHGDQIEIRGGLTEGEIVLLSAGDVKEGQTVRPRIQTAG